MRNSSSDYTSFELCTVFDSFLYITFFSHVHLQLGVYFIDGGYSCKRLDADANYRQSFL
jgi:hypothetical protein